MSIFITLSARSEVLRGMSECTPNRDFKPSPDSGDDPGELELDSGELDSGEPDPDDRYLTTLPAERVRFLRPFDCTRDVFDRLDFRF